MNAGPGLLHTLAFGDLTTGLWGAALGMAGEAPFVCVGAAGTAAAVDAQIAGNASDDEWRVSGERVELTVAPAGEPVGAAREGSDIDGFDQLCRLSGRFELDGGEHSVSSLGCRGVRGAALELPRYESLREVSAWFEPADGLAVAAFRPRKAKGHEADLVSAAVLDAEGAAAVEDPRLSTTYTAAGWPARASLELWLAGEDEQPLRRAAGEAAGGRLQSRWGELEVRAELFRWFSRGHDGAGVYLLAGSSR